MSKLLLEIEHSYFGYESTSDIFGQKQVIWYKPDWSSRWTISRAARWERCKYGLHPFCVEGMAKSESHLSLYSVPASSLHDYWLNNPSNHWPITASRATLYKKRPPTRWSIDLKTLKIRSYNSEECGLRNLPVMNLLSRSSWTIPVLLAICFVVPCTDHG